MAQAENYQVPPHPPGLEMRIQLNAIVAALVSDNSGPQEPPDPYPGMMWGDTGANRLRRRNNTNDAWINIGPLDDFLGDMRSYVETLPQTYVAKAGDTMTGVLRVNAAIILSDGTLSPRIQQAGIFGVTNSANDAWNWMMDDNGVTTWRNTMNVPTLSVTGYTYTDNLQLINRASGWTNSIRARVGGGVEFINHGYTAVIHTFGDDGIYYMISGGRLHPDGNVWMAWAGQYLSTYLGTLGNDIAGKVGRAECYRNSGVENFGPVSNNFVMPDRWVCCGANGPGNGTANAIYLYGNILRNAP